LLFVFHGHATLPPPSLSSPTSGIVSNGFEVWFSVNKVTGASGYQIQYDTTTQFNSPVLHVDTTSSGSMFTPTLRKGYKYYWRARAYKTGDTSGWSAPFNFTIYKKCQLGYPYNNATVPINGLIVSIATNFDTSLYIMEADTSPNFNSPFHRRIQQTSAFFVDTPLCKFGYKIYWKATIINKWGDTLDWSDVNNFTFNTKPSFDGSTLQVNPKYIVNWISNDLSEVILQADTSINFSSPALIERTLPPRTVRDTLTNLLFGKTYYTRIRAKFDTTYSQWSVVQTDKVTKDLGFYVPANHQVIQSLTAQFGWNTIQGANSQLQLAGDSGFTQLLKDTMLVESGYYKYPAELKFRTKYYARIRCMHAKDTTAWVKVDFTTYGGKISLGQPFSNGVNYAVRPSFQFYPETWATHYVLEIDTGKIFPLTHSSHYIKIDSFTFGSFFPHADTSLKYNQDYVWRMYALKGTDTTDTSDARTFKTAAMPLLYFPPDGAIGWGTATNGLISGIDGSTFVQWELDTSKQFNSPEYATGIDVHKADSFDLSHIELHFPSDRLFKSTYYWRARCINPVDTGKWTSPFWFSTTTDLVLTAPVNGSQYLPINQTLKWSIQGSSEDYRYQYQLATSNNFTGVPIVTLPAESFAQADVTCNFATRYYWRVRATHSRDTSGWSAVWSFKTEDAPVIYPPTLIAPEANATGLPVSPVTLSWNETTFATAYDVEVATDNTYTTILAKTSTTGTAAVFSGVRPRSRYYWHVRGKQANILGTWTADRWFETGSPVGLEENKEAIRFMMYPNPTRDQVILSAQQPVLVVVYDAKGTCVFSQTSLSAHHEIRTSDWATGLYVVKISDGEKVTLQRLVVE
jgi:hypothetical protein